MIAPWLEAAWHSLDARIRQARLPHALLVAGAAGMGKRDLAQALAARLLCTAPDAAGFACGRCRGCVLSAAGSHPDRVHVTLEARDDGKLRSEITVEQIRGLSQHLSMTPQLGGVQVALIDPADAMNVSAANALLKTLEEPSSNTVMILVSDQPSRLPATIRSRCQRVDARFPSRPAAMAWLDSKGVTSTDAARALDFAAGNPGYAVELAAPARRGVLVEVLTTLEALLTRKAQTADIALRWTREDAGERLAFVAQVVRLLSWRRLGARAHQMPELDRLARLTDQVDFSKLWAAWERTNRARQDLGGPLRGELLLVEVLRAWCELVPRTA
jgi:DNA polymerase-3 subunit delta'